MHDGAVAATEVVYYASRKIVLLLYYTQKNAHAVPLASARQRPENQKENQAGHSSEQSGDLYVFGFICAKPGNWLFFFRA